MTFDTKILNSFNDEIETVVKQGVVIHGLFLQGGSWNLKEGRLREPSPGELSIEMPCIHLNPIEKKKLNIKGLYECPLYKTSRRAGELSTTGHSTNFVMYFYLSTKDEPEHWIRRGTALLTQLDN